MDITNSGTIDGALTYIKNELPIEQAAPLRSALSRVLRTVYGQGWRQIHIRDVDVAQCIDEFARIADKDFSEHSLSAYKSRIARAIRMYSDVLAKDTINKELPTIEKTRTESHNIEFGGEAARRARARERSFREFHIAHKWNPGAQELITYPFPLATGQVIRLHLPAKLSKKDAKRLSIFIDTIAIDEIETKEEDK